jgi:ABC-type sugar transport system ATPase subunit
VHGGDVAGIKFCGITNHICRNVNFSVHSGELLVLAGATGAGKTTVLNVIAGLVSYRGRVTFDGLTVDNRPPASRNVGYLFQSFALFPHMTVRENIAFGLKARKTPPASVKKRVDDLCRHLHIEHLTDRYPKSLSGGEKQRVALARTLAPDPGILLLDEPFNSLDQATAGLLRMDLKNLQKQLGLTTIYVTHNQKEAFEMGDRIAVICQGAVEQVAKPSEILFNPRTPCVSRLFGSPAIFSCDHATRLDFGLVRAKCGSFSLVVPYGKQDLKKIAVLPSKVHLSANPIETSMPNRFKGCIEAVHPRPPMVHVDVRIKGVVITAELAAFRWEQSGLKIADTAFLGIPLDAVKTLPESDYINRFSLH